MAHRICKGVVHVEFATWRYCSGDNPAAEAIRPRAVTSVDGAIGFKALSCEAAFNVLSFKAMLFNALSFTVVSLKAVSFKVCGKRSCLQGQGKLWRLRR